MQQRQVNINLDLPIYSYFDLLNALEIVKDSFIKGSLSTSSLKGEYTEKAHAYKQLIKLFEPSYRSNITLEFDTKCGD